MGHRWAAVAPLERFQAILTRSSAAGKAMQSERVARRLAAAVAADMVGFSRLMAANEAGTLARHKV